METTTNSRNPKTMTLIAAVLLLVVGLIGGYFIGMSSDMSDEHNNSTNSSSGTTISSLASQASATGHNSADVQFAQMMVPHHAQALEMAKLADTRASSADVKALATKIEGAQQPEIDKMNGWLSAWGASSSSSSDSMSMDHGSMDMGDGMMSAADMDKLGKAMGADFDKMFLTMMTQHHTGALSMAHAELKDGQNAEALALATSISITQQAEITQMKQLLK